MSRAQRFAGRIRVACQLLAIFAMATSSSATAFAQGADLEKRLNSTEVAISEQAIGEILRDRDVVEPTLLLHAAILLDKRAKTSEAVFPFLAGRLRTSYELKYRGELSFAISLYAHIAAPLMARAMADPERVAATIEEVLNWDERSLSKRSEIIGKSASDSEVIKARIEARKSLLDFQTDLRANRARYVEYSQNYDNPSARAKMAALVEVDRRKARLRPIQSS
jgi:hypothetical protein